MNPPRISRDSVLDTALRIVEEQGLKALSMRKLSAELGVAVTAIYWHVGNREALIALLVDRVLDQLGAVTVTGPTPQARITEVAHTLRRLIHEHPHMIALVHEHGQTMLMTHPAERAMAREVAAAGLGGERGALVVRAILHHVVGYVLLERAVLQSPEQHPTKAELWHDADELDRPFAEALSADTDRDLLFSHSLDALIAGLLGLSPPFFRQPASLPPRVAGS